MKTWKDCVAFHGHECGGLTIGYKASQYAIELLNLEFSSDEQVVCISENDACGVDAIQVMLGCSLGKGNLLFHMRGKSAYSFYNRKTGQSVRLVLKPTPKPMTREESFVNACCGVLHPRYRTGVVVVIANRAAGFCLFGIFVILFSDNTAQIIVLIFYTITIAVVKSF